MKGGMEIDVALARRSVARLGWRPDLAAAGDGEASCFILLHMYSISCSLYCID
jgi:hypothetical protein